MFEESAGCKQIEVVGVMAVRRSEIVAVALRVHPEMEKSDTYAVELNALEIRPGEAGKKEIVGEELKLMEEYHMTDNRTTGKQERAVGDGKIARLIAEDMGHYLQEWVYVRVAGRIPAEAEDDVEDYSS